MFVVFGQITRSNGELVSGVTVPAYDRDPSSQQLFGEADTNDDGLYQIRISRAQFRCAEKKRNG